MLKVVEKLKEEALLLQLLLKEIEKITNNNKNNNITIHIYIFFL